MSAGQRLEIYKEAGLPRDFVARFALGDIAASHGLGHTRMATESAVTTDGSHPFWTGLDLCLVHNGSLSNHNRVRKDLEREGIVFRTENDSEVAAGYLMWRMREGASLDQALEGCLEDLDGFYTFAVGTADGFAVLRDPIACKPAVLAETDEWVAMASEYRAIATLPGSDEARAWHTAAGTDWLAAALSGGDDYELLFTVRPRHRGRLRGARRRIGDLPITRIGVVARGTDLIVRDAAGCRALPHGFQHFR